MYGLASHHPCRIVLLSPSLQFRDNYHSADLTLLLYSLSSFFRFLRSRSEDVLLTDVPGLGSGEFASDLDETGKTKRKLGLRLPKKEAIRKKFGKVRKERKEKKEREKREKKEIIEKAKRSSQRKEREENKSGTTVEEENESGGEDEDDVDEYLISDDDVSQVDYSSASESGTEERSSLQFDEDEEAVVVESASQEEPASLSQIESTCATVPKNTALECAILSFLIQVRKLSLYMYILILIYI